jgi:two-component system, OmpR family, response regulator MprA
VSEDLGSVPPMPMVLVVDDDSRVREAIQWALEDEGFEVETAADGLQAVERGTARRPDVVLLDLRLPGLDGYRVANDLRAAHGNRLPILAMTADGGAESKAARAGAYAVVRKPFELSELLAFIRRGLEAPPPGT